MIRRISVLLAVAALAAGCGEPAAPKSVPVKLMVTLDGAPMPDGDIYLYAPGKAPLAFHVEKGSIPAPAVVPVGTYLVEIALFKPDPDPAKAAAGIDITNSLPARYNTGSELTAEVKEDTPNEFIFAITSK
jgi:hypothetical protein